MKSTTTLRVERLIERIVPATYRWIGDVNTNTNDFFNYYNVDDGQRATQMPSVADRIVVGLDQQRTMYIHGNNTVDCRSFQLDGVVPIATIDQNRPPGDPSVGHVYVAGILNIRGYNVPAGAPQSAIYGGFFEIHTMPFSEPGRVNLIGGSLTYQGGEIDTIKNNTGEIYIYDSGVLKLTASAGKIGARIFIGRDAPGNNSLGYMNLDTLGNMTFYHDATIGIAPLGYASLIQGGLKLWNFGGPGGGTGWFENYGYTSVIGNINSDMYFNNVSGLVEITAEKTLDIAGWHTVGADFKASFMNGGITYMRSGSTLRLKEQYFQYMGQMIGDDSVGQESEFFVNGDVHIAAGTLQMGDLEDRFGTMTITGSLRFGFQGRLNIHASGDENKNDKVSANSITLEPTAVFGVHTTDVPGPGATERTFLIGTVTGTWSDTPVQTGDFMNWAMDATQKKIKKPAS
jgi:hypothetical protein